jgi:hypothetical protein
MNFCRLLFLTALSALSFTAKSQIADNFADGDFTQNPIWQGDAASFIVNPAAELQLNASVAGASALVVQGNIPGNATWDLRFRLGFAPSTSNLLRIFLMSDQQDLANANAYFLEIGESGTTDALRLFRQDGAVKTLLGTGEAGLVALNPDIHLLVTRTLSGQWTVEAASGTGALTPQFSATDATHPGGPNRFFGFQCVYTVSNITKYFFDDITIALGAPDTDPPTLLSANADNDLQVTAVFSEALNPVTATSFSISGGIGQPATATLLPDGVSVQLALSTPMVTGSYTLQSTGVEDIAGNASALQTINFQFTKTETASEFDILINEIMADPTPMQGLPEVEWFELFNRSTKTLDLATLRIQDATGSPVPFPSYLLAPGAYVAITAGATASTLQSATTGAVLGVPIGVTTLNNDGDILTISDASGLVIDRVAYDLDWHTSILKKDGGWSLERINPGLTCLGSENWQSCPDNIGGTPGLPNAALSTAPDATAPHLLQVIIESTTSLLVSFSEGLDKNTAQDPAAYNISPARNIATAQQLPSNLAQVRLTLSDPLQLSTVYALSGKASLTDCSGNALSVSDTVFFGVAEAPTQHDVIINEIMAKPAPSAGLPPVEWLELLNRSTKIIDLASLRLQDLSGSSATLPSFLLVPGDYIALTAFSNAAVLQASSAGRVLGVGMSSSLFNDDGDIITLSDLNGNAIDRVSYDPSWHTEDGKEDGGWSLERINYDLPCLGNENWQSCPALPGGTPGLRNAAFQNTTDEKTPHMLWAYPESANTVLLNFTEGLEKSTAENIHVYHFFPDRTILSATQQANILQVQLTLSEPMEDAVLYQITVTPTLRDCNGNSAVETDTVVVGVPQKPDPLDIVVNEVMFNPASGDARYLEFYNRSNKIFNWDNFFIANQYTVLSSEQITQKRLSIPGQYDVFTTDAPNIREHFNNIIQRNVLENALPTLSDREGVVRLYWVENGDTVELDALHYQDEWHNGLYSVGDRNGVALERIRTEGPTNDNANWTSASAVITGAPGTPTLPNSQRLSDINPADNLITLSPARLSPDDDGYEDFLDIHYLLPQEGYAATVGIFDSDGNRVKYLVRQELLGTEGALRWDGDTEDGSKARPGVYILFLEIFRPDGSVMRLKKVFAVVAKN